jgi:hypothetical protein
MKVDSPRSVIHRRWVFASSSLVLAAALAAAGASVAPAAVNPMSSWPVVARTVSMDPLALSCASMKFCMAIGWSGKGYAASPEYSSIWNESTASKAARIPGAFLTADDDVGGLGTLSCPTSTYCMAAGVGDDTYDWSAGKWRAVPIGYPQPVKPPPPATSEEVAPRWVAVTCFSATSCLAIGSVRWDVFHGEKESLDVATTFDRWNGRTWSRLQTFQKLDVLAMSCATHTQCMAIGTQSTLWNGRRWTIVPVAKEPGLNLPPATYTSVSCTRSFTCVAVGTNDASYDVSTAVEWFGGKWHIFSVPKSTILPVGIACVIATDCFETGYVDSLSTPSYVSTYTDASLGWTSHKVAGEAYAPSQDIAAQSASSAVVIDKPLHGVGTYWIAEKQ